MHPIISLPAIGILLVIAAAGPVAVQESPYGSYNQDAFGTHHLFGVGKLDGLVPFLTYRNDTVWLAHGRVADLYPQSDSVLLVGPSRVYTDEEARGLREFLEAGGRVLLADDTGTGGDLLADLNLPIGLPKVPIFTPGYSKTPDYPIAFSTGALPGLPDQVILHRPSIVEGAGAVVLRAPDFTWLDQDADGRPDIGEPRQAYPLAMTLDVGRGELLVVGDASLFTKDLTDANPGVVQALLDWLVPPGRVLYIDESHRASADPMGITPALSGHTPAWLQWTLLAFSIGASFTLAYSVRLRRRRPAVRPRFLVAGRPATPTEAAALAELEP